MGESAEAMPQKEQEARGRRFLLLASDALANPKIPKAAPKKAAPVNLRARPLGMASLASPLANVLREYSLVMSSSRSNPSDGFRSSAGTGCSLSPLLASSTMPGVGKFVYVPNGHFWHPFDGQVAILFR